MNGEIGGVVGVPPSPRRSDADERKRALLAKADRLGFLRQARDEGWPEGFALCARAIILAGLPIRPTAEKEITRSARFADGSTMEVTFAAVGKDARMPYGADTNLLLFLVDRAIRAKSALFEWRSASEYLRFMRMNPESRKNVHDLRRRFARLVHLAIQIRTKSAEFGEMGKGMFLIEDYLLPSSVSAWAAREGTGRLPGLEYGLRLNESFFRAAASRPVPVPKELIRELREDPLLLRFALFAGYRSFGAKTSSVVPWEDVRSLIGSDVARIRRFRQEIRTSLEALRAFWPEVNAEIESNGLRIGPPARHLLPDGAQLKD